MSDCLIILIFLVWHLLVVKKYRLYHHGFDNHYMLFLPLRLHHCLKSCIQHGLLVKGYLMWIIIPFLLTVIISLWMFISILWTVISQLGQSASSILFVWATSIISTTSRQFFPHVILVDDTSFINWSTWHTLLNDILLMNDICIRHFLLLYNIGYKDTVWAVFLLHFIPNNDTCHFLVLLRVCLQ